MFIFIFNLTKLQKQANIFFSRLHVFCIMSSKICLHLFHFIDSFNDLQTRQKGDTVFT